MPAKDKDQRDQDTSQAQPTSPARRLPEDERPQPHAEEGAVQPAGPLVAPAISPGDVEEVPLKAVFGPTAEISAPSDPRAETPQNQTLPKALPVSPEDTAEGQEAAEKDRK